MGVLAILGASGHGKVIADTALCSGWQDVVFFDDAWPDLTKLNTWEVIGNTKCLLETATNYDGILIAIGNNAIRMEKASQLNTLGVILTTLIHPAAIVSRFATIGQGTVVFAGVVINADARIGNHCIINTNVTVEHECILGNGVHLSPNATLAGQASVDDLSWIGISASVKQLVNIGKQVTIGAGSVVLNDIPDHATAVGVPAKIMSKQES